MRKGWIRIVGLLILSSWYGESAIAQIQPDRTLGTESSVIAPNVLIRGVTSDRIEGGAVRGDNLFHSFQEFNIGESRGAYFANPTNITNIFSRVTGSNPSNLMGTLGVLGNANLYFLNPNGIVFGANARLDVRGSFVGSTASGFKFANGSEFSATDPQALPLLQMSVLPGLQYGANSPRATIVNRGMLAAGQDLTLQAAQLDLQGQLQAGRDLALQAIDTVQVRDSTSQAFVAQAGGKLLVQGDRAIDIFALNHPNSGLVSGGDMVLRSANSVGGDAHYWTGGNFRIEKLDGSLGILSSPDDPIIRAAGDVALDLYVGASLHILAGGSVNIPQGVRITTTDVAADTLQETIVLPNGQIQVIDGSRQPTLDIRAGINTAIPPFTPPGAGLTETAPPIGAVPPGQPVFGGATSADINIGDVVFTAPNGVVFLSTQYQPNLSLPGGDINVNVNTVNTGLWIPGVGINTNSGSGNAGSVTIVARQNIIVNSPINTSSATGNAGNTNLFAGEKIEVNRNISSDVKGTGAAGNIYLSAPQVTVQDGANVSVNTFGSGNGGALTIANTQDLILRNTGQLSAITGDTLTPNTGRGGKILLDVANSVILDRGFIFASTNSNGDAGSLDIKTNRFTAQGGSLISGSSLGSGSGGTINFNVGDAIDLVGNDEVILSPTNRISPTTISLGAFGTGQGGNLAINTGNLRISDGAQIYGSTGKDTGGNAANVTIFATGSVNIIGSSAFTDGSRAYSRLSSDTFSLGNAGNLNLTTPTLSVTDGGEISAGTTGVGQAGRLAVNAKVIRVEGRSIDDKPSRINFDSYGTGDAGGLNLQTQQLIITDGGRVSAATANAGQGGVLAVNATDLVTISGQNSGLFFNGLSGSFADARGIDLTTTQLQVLQGGQITVSGEGSGKAGDLNMNARTVLLDQAKLTATTASAQGGNIRFQNLDSLTLQNGSLISASTIDGQGGNVTVNVSAGTVTLQSGSEISARATGTGTAGSLSIATQTLNLRNGSTATVSSVNGGGGSLDVNATQAVNLQDSSRLGAEATGSGTAGNVRINTDRLTLENRSRIGVDSNQQGGNLTIEARLIFMDNGARLIATTAAANGGNITLKVLESITLRHDSDIRAEATGNGNGGNITLTAGRFISAILSENSDVLAFAPQGQGGRITAKAQGIFGFRLFQGIDTLESDFVASGGSDLLNGVIDIDTRNPQPSPPLPNNFADPQVTQGCQASPTASRSPVARSQLFYTGTGGLPASPSEPLQSNRTRVPWNTLEPSQSSPTEIREAQGWVKTTDGRVRLVASELALRPCLAGGQP